MINDKGITVNYDENRFWIMKRWCSRWHLDARTSFVRTELKPFKKNKQHKMQYWQNLNLKHFHTYALNCLQFNSRGIVFWQLTGKQLHSLPHVKPYIEKNLTKKAQFVGTVLLEKEYLTTLKMTFFLVAELNTHCMDDWHPLRSALLYLRWRWLYLTQLKW